MKLLWFFILLGISTTFIGCSSAKSKSHHKSSFCFLCERDSRGHIKRSQTSKNEFKREQPCPSTGLSFGACPGYVIDHIQPLKRGGADLPNNMQWQTKAEAKAKDKVE